MQTAAIQTALLQHGYTLGPSKADGIWGRATIAAVKAFQTDSHLPATGVMDAATQTALFGARTAPAQVSPVWYEEANRLMGLREAPGPANNPIILGWARQIGGWVANFYTADSIPWCALFMSHCIAATLPDERLPSNPLSALTWDTFGVKLTVPSVGAICIFTRNGGGHVAFYVGEDETTIHTLGGNQSDAVTIARLPKSRLTGFRWPASAPAPNGRRTILTATGPVSRNEA